MGFFKEIGEVGKYFKAAKAAPEITFYSESSIYYQNFRGTIEAILKKSDYKVLYITSDAKDPVLNISNDRIVPFYINKLVPFIFPFINTRIFVLTMADLNKHHVKRSYYPVNHIYMFHAINSIHLQYNQGAFDYYDTIFCVGPHHIEEIRKTEEVYNLPPKRLINVGYSWLEELERNYRRISSQQESDKKKLLIAPSWHAGNILETCIDTILENILPLPYEIVVRPHPEFIKRQGDKVKKLQEKYGDHNNFFLETNSASSQNVQESELLITDWSGIAIEFSLGMGKPVIFIDTPKKVHNPEYKKIGIVPLEDRIRNLIGTVIKPSDCIYIDREIEKALNNKEEKRETLVNLRNDIIFNWGRSSEVGADYIIQYCEEKQ